jgi:hypothetical protein
MYSPFYESDQRILYPHRSQANTPKAIAARIKELTDAGTVTLLDLRNTSFKDLIKAYFPRADSEAIYQAFKLIDKETGFDLLSHPAPK